MPEATFMTSDGCFIAYTLRKTRDYDAPRIVLVHSLALDRTIWDGVAASLANDASVLTYDCRGHGRSSRKAGLFTPELFARDLAELLDQVGWQSAVVAGCSMGGCVAQAFGGLHPERASALGLIDTTAWYGAEAPAQWRERAENARAKGLAGLVEFQVSRWFGDKFRAEHPERISATSAVFLANDIDCYAAACVMLGEADLRRYLPSLRMPVAVIVGEEDYATPLEHARYLNHSIAGSSLTVIPGARHLTPLECPDQIAAQLLTVWLLARSAAR